MSLNKLLDILRRLAVSLFLVLVLGCSFSLTVRAPSYVSPSPTLMSGPSTQTTSQKYSQSFGDWLLTNGNILKSMWSQPED